MRTILPTKAGLTKFCPMPPKNCFTTIIATASPIMTIQRGIVDGRLNASNMPVTIADRSPIVLSRFITLRLRYSKSTQAQTLTATIRSERKPNNTTESTRAGMSAIMTSSIMPVVVSLVRLCGEALTVRSLSSIICSPPL